MGLLAALGGQRVYLDANVFIYAFEGTLEFQGELVELFERLDLGELEAVTSELTLAEVLVKPLRDGRLELQQSFEAALTTSGGLSVAPVSRGVLLEAARLRASVASLKLPDAIHAATARLTACPLLLTNDDRQFQRVPGLRVLRLDEAVLAHEPL